MTTADDPQGRESSFARVFRLAAPIIVSNVSVPLLGAVDTAVVGHLPDPAYLGGVAVGSTIFSFLYWGFGFLRMGTTGFVAQARGACDGAEIRAVLGRALLTAAALGLLLIALQGPIRSMALGLVGASPAVDDSAAGYVAVRIWSAPATLANYALLGWLFGMQRPKTALVLLVLTNGLNIVLDLWFVVGLGWGVPGVAGASVIADYAAGGLGLFLILRTLPGRTGWERRRLFERTRLFALVRVNRDIFLRTLCLVFAFAWFTVQGARLGDLTLAANAVLLNLQSIMAYGLDGFAFAAEALVEERSAHGTAGRLAPWRAPRPCGASAWLRSWPSSTPRSARRSSPCSPTCPTFAWPRHCTCPGWSPHRWSPCGATSSTACTLEQRGPWRCATAWRSPLPCTSSWRRWPCLPGAITACGWRS